MPTNYYVDGAVGNDGNAGTSEGAGNAWATLTKAETTYAAGDRVYVKASATYSEQLTFVTVGTGANSMIWEGYTSTVGDGGIVTIDGGSSRTYCVKATGLSTQYYIQMRNFKLQNATSHGWYGGRSVHWMNCTFGPNGGYGAYGSYGNALHGCTCNTNTGHGHTSQTGVFTNCTFGANTSIGSFCSVGPGTYMGCVAYSNALNNIKNDSGTATQVSAILNCTCDGDAKDTDESYEVDGLYAMVFLNNIGYDSVDGVHGNSSTRNEAMCLAYNNLMTGNTTNYGTYWFAGDSDLDGGTVGFTDEASQDYSLTGSSAAQGAGTGFGTFNIGAYQESAVAGSGAAGGLITHPGMTGGING